MGILTKDELARRLERGELLRNPRRQADGTFGIEPASYDLTAGKAVWKEPTRDKQKGTIKSLFYQPGRPVDEQATMTLQPGQMLFVITHEDVLMPPDLCGTVYSRNKLALDGILALNAGHIDPGFEGPIVIRLINLRATPWTLTLGTPIFTIVYQTLEVKPEDRLISHQPISADETLLRVRESADEALSNALYDLYALEIQDKLDRHFTVAEQHLRENLPKDFVRRDEFGQALWKWFRSRVLALLILISILATILAPWWQKIIDFLRGGQP